MRRRCVIGVVTALVLVAAGLTAALATAGGTATRARQVPVARLHRALAAQVRLLNRGMVPQRAVTKHALRAIIPPGGTCAVGATRCSLKPCVEFAGSAQATAVAVAAPTVSELDTPQLLSPRRPSRSAPAVPPAPPAPMRRALPVHPARTDCRAVPAVGQRRLVPVSLATTSASS